MQPPRPTQNHSPQRSPRSGSGPAPLRAGVALFTLSFAGSFLGLALSASQVRADEPPSPGSAPTEAPAPLNKPPKLVRFVHAESPPSLAERGHVDVKLDIVIDDKGAVQSANVLESGGADFDAAALAAARQFQFEPGEAEGKPVPVRITYTYRFAMKPVAPPPAPPATPETQAPAAPAATPTPPPPVDTVPLSGRVLRKGDRVPVIGAAVSLDDAEPLLTDDDGRFSFPAVTPGKHMVRVRGVGMENVDSEEELTRGKKREVTYFISVKVRYRSTVRGARATREVVEQTLDVEEIKRIPGTAGDTLKAVQNLPGVARAPFGGGQLVVWGSAPGDTRVYVDGVAIPTLYHFGGLRATVNSEVVSDLTFTPGGYGAAHGRGLGGLVEVATRAPRTDGYHGFVQLDLFDGSLSIEGPISKTVSFGVTARRSWADVFLGLITPNDIQLSPKYWDYQVRLNWKATPRDDVRFLLFGSDDAVEVKLKSPDPNLSGQFTTHTFYHRLLATWTHRFDSGGVLTVTPSTGYNSPFNVNVQFGGFGLKVNALQCPYDLRVTFRQPVGKNVRVDAGLDVEGNRWGLSATTPASGQPGEASPPAMSIGNGVVTGTGNLFTTGIAPWAALQLTDDSKRFEMNLGLRLDTFNFGGTYKFTVPGQADVAGGLDSTYFTPEGRVSLRYQIKPWVALKGAFGYYHQAPSPSDLWGPILGNPKAQPESASHWVAGIDWKPTQTLSISMEGFYKDLRDLVVPAERQGAAARVNDGIGRVYGGEILVRQQLWKGLFAWVSYTVSRAERKDHPDTDWRLFQYDQTHILTAIASYQWGRGYQVGLRFRYVTGSPYTPVNGSYFDANTGGYVPINAPLYSGRLPDFNQLDVRFDKKWEFKRWSFALYVDIQNLYNAQNPEGYQYNFDFSKQPKSVSGIPFFPVLGIRGDF